MSRAAASLLRALINRAGIDRDRILLTEMISTDWQSLTFTGERHVIHLKIVGPEAEAALSGLSDGLSEAEFDVPGQIVADIGLVGTPQRDAGGSIAIEIEALTISE